KPESNAPLAVEVLDLFDIVKLAHDGNQPQARRNFAARSQWLAPAFGQVLAVDQLLRTGATSDELVGPLAKSPDTMGNERRDQTLAAMLEKDKNNKTLWSRILPYASATSFERLSRPVWNGEKSHFIAKTKDKHLDAYLVTLYEGDPLTQVDAMLLHSAVTAKA